jgi:signal peptidase II
MTSRPRALLLALALLTIGCDRVTKHFASAKLKSLPRQSFLNDSIRLEYAENSGAFLSLGAQLPETARTVVFTFGTAVILSVVLILARRQRLSPRVALGLTLAWAGGLSNLIDRAAQGHVVDFLNVGLGPLRTGIFNIADVAILTGTAIAVWKQWDVEPKESALET